MKWMREIYNEATRFAGVPEVVMLPCENCGDIVTFHRLADGTTAIIHDGCEAARVSLMVDQPRKLGVISSIT